MGGLVALLLGKPGSGKTAFAKFLIRNEIIKGYKGVDGRKPVEGITIFCADPAQWAQIVPEKCIITPKVLNDFNEGGVDWWDKFYGDQQEHLMKFGRYSKQIVVLDDIFFFPKMVKSGGNVTTKFEQALSMYRVMDLCLLVTAQRANCFTVSLRLNAYILGFFPLSGEAETDNAYKQFSEGLWDNKNQCRDDFHKLAALEKNSFVYVNKRRQIDGGGFEKRIERLTSQHIKGNELMKIVFENDEEMIPRPIPTKEDGKLKGAKIGKSIKRSKFNPSVPAINPGGEQSESESESESDSDEVEQ